MRPVDLVTRGLVVLGMWIGVAPAASIPSKSAKMDISSRQIDHLNLPFAVQRCAAPLDGQWYGSSPTSSAAAPTHYTSEPDETPIQEIAVYHSRGNSRVYEIKVTWKSGRIAKYGTRSGAPADAREDSLRLLEDEHLVLMQVETRDTASDRLFIIGLYFQTNKGRYTVEFGKPTSISYRPIGIGQDATARKQHFLVTGTARAQDSPDGVDYHGPLRYINGFEVLARSEGGIQAIMPVWQNSEKTFHRKIVDIRSDQYAGNNANKYRGHFSDAMLDVLTPGRLDRVSLKSITTIHSFFNESIVGIKSTWLDGSETITGPAHGDEIVKLTNGHVIGTFRRPSKIFNLKQNEVVVEIEYWHSVSLGLLSARFIYNVYTPKSDGTFSSEQKISAWHGNPDPESIASAKKSIWTAPSPGKQGLIGFQGLLAPTPPYMGVASTENSEKVAFDDMVAVKPLWVQSPPIKATLAINEVRHGEIIESLGSASTEGGSSLFIVNNPGPTCITQTVNWGFSKTVGNTLSMSESSSITTGMSTSFSTTVGASAGAFGVEVHAEATFGFEAFAEFGKEQTSEKSWETSKEIRFDQSVSIPAPPWSVYRASARTGLVKVEDSTWTGTLTQTFMDGSTKEFEVSGTFAGTDGASIMEIVVEYDVHPSAPEGFEPSPSACGAARSDAKITYKKVPGLAEQLQAEE